MLRAKRLHHFAKHMAAIIQMAKHPMQQRENAILAMREPVPIALEPSSTGCPPEISPEIAQDGWPISADMEDGNTAYDWLDFSDTH
jgi:hypothetical protein